MESQSLGDAQRSIFIISSCNHTDPAIWNKTLTLTVCTPQNPPIQLDRLEFLGKREPKHFQNPHKLLGYHLVTHPSSHRYFRLRVRKGRTCTGTLSTLSNGARPNTMITTETEPPEPLLGPFISGSSHAVLRLGQKPRSGKVHPPAQL